MDAQHTQGSHASNPSGIGAPTAEEYFRLDHSCTALASSIRYVACSGKCNDTRLQGISSVGERLFNITLRGEMRRLRTPDPPVPSSPGEFRMEFRLHRFIRSRAASARYAYLKILASWVGYTYRTVHLATSSRVQKSLLGHFISNPFKVILHLLRYILSVGLSLGQIKSSVPPLSLLYILSSSFSVLD